MRVLGSPAPHRSPAHASIVLLSSSFYPLPPPPPAPPPVSGALPPAPCHTRVIQARCSRKRPSVHVLACTVPRHASSLPPLVLPVGSGSGFGGFPLHAHTPLPPIGRSWTSGGFGRRKRASPPPLPRPRHRLPQSYVITQVHVPSPPSSSPCQRLHFTTPPAPAPTSLLAE